MSPRARVIAAVALASAAAAALTVGLAVVQSRSDGSGAPAAERPRPRGAPPLVLDLGVRADAEAVALRRAAALYERGRRQRAAFVFGRHSSLEARVGAAVARWPEGTVADLRSLARRHADRGVVRLNLGFALFWSGRAREALGEWRAAERAEPDTLYAVRAGDVLHTDYAPGLPPFVPSGAAPPNVLRLGPADRLASLRRRAAGRANPRDLLLYGAALQQTYRPLSARSVFDRAARSYPRDVESQVAAAVGRFDKARPELAFARLGPLSSRYPRSATVRLHLGLLLLWIGRVDDGRRQLALARAADPRGRLGREANRLLARLTK